MKRYAALLSLAVAGCGGSSDSDVASKSPQEILADMRGALADVHSYHIDGTQTDKDGRTRIVGDVSGSSLRFRLLVEAKSAQLVLSGGESFIRANRAFWKSEGGVSKPQVERLLSDRWVKLPRGGAGSLGGLVAEFAPKNLGHCLSTETGSISKRGTADLAGRRVVVLIDKGDKPGTSPGELSVAASGPTLPLRIVQKGRKRPGGRNDPRCGTSDSTTTAGDVRLSRFDEAVRITPPTGALDLDKLAGGNAA